MDQIAYVINRLLPYNWNMKNNYCRIAHISDIHVGLENELPYGVDVRYHFLRILQSVKASAIDLIILTGDVTFRSKAKIPYHWVKEQLDLNQLPYFIIPGNHDDAAEMAEIFNLTDLLKQNKLYYQKYFKDQSLIFLDSSTAIIDQFQLDWLEQIDKTEQKSHLLFVHHPPILCNCYYMDKKYPLKNHQEVFQRISQLKNVDHIFSGHYHTEKILSIKNKNIYLTPSTFYQIDSQSKSFKIEHHYPGWRYISWNGQRLETQAKYVY
ncbi:MAG: metallophosphoesterase [Spirochaetes bacterium]|nr:metallophosphoesterase [Spirochaetota bacterium]